MKISVIIPVFNEEKNIAECILSLKKQTLKDLPAGRHGFEIIVVDDGSTDNTLEILNELKVKTFEQKHQGPAMARNLGAKHANGKILVFVDADMTFNPNFLRKLITPITQNKTKGTFSKEEFVNNWNNVWARCWNINENLPEKRRLSVNYPDHQKVFRAILKNEFDRVGGFSEGGYTDDYTLSDKLGYEAVNAPDAIFYHKNPDSLKEVYFQAKWAAKREYKLGLAGTLFTLFMTFLPLSIIDTTWQGAIKFGYFPLSNFYDYSHYLIFKVVYDFGIFVGILEMIFTGKLSK